MSQDSFDFYSMGSKMLYWTAVGATGLAMCASAVIAYKRFRTLAEPSSNDIQNLQKLIKDNKVLVLSKTYCPYCIRTKRLLDDLKAEYTAIELDTREDGETLQSAALKLTGQRTVPNVFIAGENIGGNDMVQALHKNGKLIPLLKAAGALQ